MAESAKITKQQNILTAMDNLSVELSMLESYIENLHPEPIVEKEGVKLNESQIPSFGGLLNGLPIRLDNLGARLRKMQERLTKIIEG